VEKLTAKDTIDKNALDLRVAGLAPGVCPAKVKNVRRLLLKDLKQFTPRQILQVVYQQE